MISTHPTPENIAVVLDLLRETPLKLSALAESHPDDHLHHPLTPGERSFKEVLVHLVNSEARLAESIYLALLLEKPDLPTIHPERDWGSLVSFQAVDLDALLIYFQVRRTVLLEVLNDLEGGNWSRTVQDAGKKRRESVYWKARTLALHEQDHLKDLKLKLKEKTW